MPVSAVRFALVDSNVSIEEKDYKTYCRITERDCFKYITPDECIKQICELYNEASPDYNAIISNIEFEDETEDNKNYIRKMIISIFTKKRHWIHRATLKQYWNGSYYAEFRHPLAYQTGAYNHTVYPQGNKLRRVVSHDYDEATIIIAELNEILAEPDYWMANGVQRAREKFRPKTFEVFFKPTK